MKTKSPVDSDPTASIRESAEEAGIPASRPMRRPPSPVEDGRYPHQCLQSGSSRVLCLGLDTDVATRATSSPRRTKGRTLGTTQLMQRVRPGAPDEALPCRQTESLQKTGYLQEIRLKSTWMGVRGRRSPFQWQRPFPQDAPHSLQSSTGTVSSQIHRQIPNTWNQTTSKSSYTYNYGDNPAKISSHMLPTNSLKGCPLLILFITRPLSHKVQLYSENQQLQDHQHGRRCPAMHKNSLYRTIKLQQTPQNTKLTIAGPHQNYKCPLCIKLNISIP